MGTELGPNFSLAKRVSDLEGLVRGLLTRDVLQNASIGADGLLVYGGGSINIDGGGTLILDGVNLATLIGQSISPAVGQASALGFVLGTGYGTIATFDFIVPAGYTRAVVSVSGFVSGSSGSTGGERLYGVVTIAGVAGPESIQVWTVNEVAANVTAAYTRSLTGLSTGQHLTVLLSSRLQVGPGANLFSGFNNANVIGTALFLA